jgi:hypothetical protein
MKAKEVSSRDWSAVLKARGLNFQDSVQDVKIHLLPPNSLLIWNVLQAARRKNISNPITANKKPKHLTQPQCNPLPAVPI